MAIDFSKYSKSKKESPPSKIDFSKYKTTSETPGKIDFAKYKSNEQPSAATEEKPKKQSLLSKIGEETFVKPFEPLTKPIGNLIQSTIEAAKAPDTMKPLRTDYPGGYFNPLNDLGHLGNTKAAHVISNIGKEFTLPGAAAANIGVKSLARAAEDGFVKEAAREAETLVKPKNADTQLLLDRLAQNSREERQNFWKPELTKEEKRAYDSHIEEFGRIKSELKNRGVSDDDINAALTEEFTDSLNHPKPAVTPLVKTVEEGVSKEFAKPTTKEAEILIKPKPTPQTLSEVVSLQTRVKGTEEAVKKTERSISNLNKQIEIKGTASPRAQQRMGDLRKELSANKAILANREAKLERVDTNNIKVDKVDLTPDNIKNLVSTATKDVDVANLKDFSGFKFNTTDIYRNFRDVFKGRFGQVKKLILDPFDASKKEYATLQENLIKDLKTNVVDKLGIQKGSKLSAVVQDYGEKKISLEQLKEAYPKDWGKVVEADAFFRKKYDDLLDQINATRAKIYPRSPEKLIPKRADYYRHFKEFNDLVGLKNIFETPANISPKLEGLSEFTKPNSKFQGFMQKRGLGKYKKDAVGGFLEYIPGASYAIHIDPHINVFKKLGDEIAKKTEESKNLNSFINYLGKYSQDLAGKTNAADRWVQENIPGGRMTMGALNWINSRVKSNVILGNVASALSQVANIPVGIAFAKQYSIDGAKQTLASILGRNMTPIKESGFLTERYVGSNYRQFDKKLIEQPRKLASWILETADRVGTEFVWNSAYAKGVAEKVADPIKYADDATRSLIAGRGIGEVPLLQKAKLFQILAPFQLEVANLWRVQGDMLKVKDFTGIATLFVASYLFNKAMEQVRGSGVLFDPIQAVVDASQPDLSPLQRAGRLGGEILSNVPLGQTLAAAYPEYGAGKLPSREQLFGDNDPTRFGTGLPLTKGIQNPLVFLAPPFGGNQAKKTIEGTTALIRGDNEKNGKLKYQVQRTPSNIAKSLLFGPNATKEARAYYKQDRRPLSEDQTKGLKNSSNPDQYYTNITRKREFDKINRKMDEVSADKSLSSEERKRKMDSLRKEFADLRKKYGGS